MKNSPLKKSAKAENDAEYNKHKEFIKDEISGKVRRYFGKTVEEASKREIYTAVSFTIRDQIMEKWVNYKQVADKKPQKELYYLSFEFLMGRALGNNLMNIRETNLYRDALSELNIPRWVTRYFTNTDFSVRRLLTVIRLRCPTRGFRRVTSGILPDPRI